MMKAIINEKGNLNIKAETSLESYALQKWWDCYYKKGGAETFSIETYNESIEKACKEAETPDS